MDALRWDDLRTFLAVADGGTLAAAADALDVNPSTVHRRVHALEQALGATLFERTPRGYALTSVGEALVPSARDVDEAVGAVRRVATGHDRTARGPVTITLPETLLSVVAPELVAVRETAPGLRPVVRADDRLLDLGAEADLALRPQAQPPEDVVGRRVGTVGWAVYGPAHDGAADMPWVVFADGCGPSAASAWRRRHHPEVPVLLEVSSVGAMHRVLGCTRAQGMLPCYLADPDSRFARRTPPIPEASVDLWLLIHADLRRSARVRALVDLLVPRLAASASRLSGEISPDEKTPLAK